MKHLKNTTSIIAVAAVAGFVGFASSGANAAVSDPATASATLVSAIAVTYGGTPLAFGSIGIAANTVTIDTAGARTATDASQLAGGTTSAANFNVTGNPSAAFTITLPASATITDPVSTDTMTVNGFTDSLSGTGALSGAGAASFTVGGDLNIVGTETAGAYTGTFTVTVNY